MKTTEEIYLEYNGRDEAERIKLFIKDAIEKYDINYVSIFGDIELIPIRICKTGQIGTREYILSDSYYADIYDANGSYCSWDADNDNLFGEMRNQSTPLYSYDFPDCPDLIPDIGIGRLPCKNTYEVKVIIDKIIQYETGVSDKGWFKRIILIGGDTHPTDTPEIIDGEIVTDQIAQLMKTHNFDITKLWASQGNFNPLIINREISKGAGFVSYSGHGYEYGFGTYDSYSPDDIIIYWSPFLFGLLNGNKLPVVFFDACLTAKLDADFHGFSFPCIAWHIVKKPVGGAIASIGATRTAVGFVTDEGAQCGCTLLNVLFFKNYKDGIILSDMFIKAQKDLINESYWLNQTQLINHIVLEEYILLGDPSLKIGGYR